MFMVTVWGLTGVVPLLAGVAHAGAPTVTNVSQSCNEDGTGYLTLSATDPDGNGFSFSISSSPANGTVSISGNRATYVPNANWSGTDSFRYVATDTTGAVSAPGTGTITVRAVNDAPVATDVSITTARNTAKTTSLSATDPDGPSLTYTITANPSHGTVRLVGNNASYTPTGGYTGADSYTFRASDGSASDTGTVSITVTGGANTAPTATNGSASGNEDTAVTATLSGSDADGDALTYSVVRAPGNGTVAIAGNRATYTPNSNWSGSDSFTWRAYDGTSYSGTASTSITILAVNDTPVANAQSVSTSEDTPVTFRLTSTDPDATSSPTYAVAVAPSHGSVTIVGANATYTPDSGWSGADSFQFTASDGSATSARATVTLTVTASSDAPVAWPSYGQTSQGTAVALEAAWTDADSTSATFSVVTNPSNGRVTATASGFRYTPNLGFYGVDRFTWRVTADGASDTATMQVNVHPTPDLYRADMPQIGVNGVEFGHGAEPGDWSTAEPQFQPDNIFADFGDLGVQIFRQAARGDLMWSLLERSDDVFQDADANDVLTNGFYQPTTTLFEIQYASPTPPWCTSGEPFQKTMGADAYDYLDHVLDNYADWVDSYEIGNEMWHWVAASGSGGGSGAEELPDCVPSDGYSPAEQAVFIETAARYLKAGDPDAYVSMPSVNPNNTLTDEWLTEVVAAAGDTDWFDYVTYHEYDAWSRAYNNRDELTTLFDDLGLSDKLVRLTEAGSSSDADYTDRTDYPNSDSTQCADIFRRTMIGWGNGDATVIWHTYLPISENPTGGEFQGYEIEEFDGSYKAAAYTFTLLTENLVPFKQITPYVQSGQYVYKVVTDDGSERYVVWGSGRYTVPSGVTEYASVVPDAAGEFDWNATASGSSVTLSTTPFLFR